MAATPPTLPDLNVLDPDALKALILTQHETLLSRETEIENLKLLILKLRRMQFGRKSEKLDRHIEQLELRLEDLESAETASAAPQSDAHPQTTAADMPGRRPVRRPLPDHLPRETQTHQPEHTTCPECGGTLRQFAEDVSELLEFVPARFKVIRVVRPKMSCAGCAHIVQAPAPSRPIDRGLAGPGLLAHVLVSKYSDHLPLYRQAEIYERSGLDLDRSTLADWVGESSSLCLKTLP
jgi:transposase